MLNKKFNISNPMERISLVEFRRNARAVIRKVSNGRSVVLTLRNRPVVRLEPVAAAQISSDDPFYRLGIIATRDVAGMTNEEIDEVVYRS
jgi:prevent-host-death family protein